MTTKPSKAADLSKPDMKLVFDFLEFSSPIYLSGELLEDRLLSALALHRSASAH